MSDGRKRLIAESFKKLDRTGDGVVTLDDLHTVYNVKHNPRYLRYNIIQFSTLHSLISKLPHPTVEKKQKSKFLKSSWQISSPTAPSMEW